jgi:hypothetical protein
MPDDPFLRALAEHWDDVMRLADEEQRELLRGLVAGDVEPDPVDARAALADVLLDVLPPDHPLVEVLRTGTMLAGTPGDDVKADIAMSLRRLRDLEFGSALSVSAESPALDEFDREVQARLLELPAYSPDEVRDRGADPNDSRLIRLPRPDHEVQLPAFQFAEPGLPWPIVQEVNALLHADADPWGVTCWWVDPHARLDTVPSDLLGRGEDRLLLRAAQAVGED